MKAGEKIELARTSEDEKPSPVPVAAVKSCPLGQIGSALDEIGGQYRHSR